MCKIILHNQENSTCKSIILSMLRLMINFEYEVFYSSVSFQQLLHFLLCHPRSADILTRHLRKGTVVVCVQQFRQLLFDYSIFCHTFTLCSFYFFYTFFGVIPISTIKSGKNHEILT